MNLVEEKKNLPFDNETIVNGLSHSTPVMEKKEAVILNFRKRQAELDFTDGKAKNSISNPVAYFNSHYGHGLSKISKVSETNSKTKGPLYTLSQKTKKFVEGNSLVRKQNSEGDNHSLHKAHSYINGKNYYSVVTRSTPRDKFSTDKIFKEKIKEEGVSLKRKIQDYGRVDLSDQYFTTTKRLCISKSFSKTKKMSKDREKEEKSTNMLVSIKKSKDDAQLDCKRISQHGESRSELISSANKKKNFEICHNDFNIVNNSISPLCYFNDQNDVLIHNNLPKCLNDNTIAKKPVKISQSAKPPQVQEKKNEKSSCSTSISQTKNAEFCFNPDTNSIEKSLYSSLREKMNEAHLNTDKNIIDNLMRKQSKGKICEEDKGNDDQCGNKCVNDVKIATLSTNEEPVRGNEKIDQQKKGMYTHLQEEIESLNNNQPLENTRFERIEQCSLKFSKYFNKMISQTNKKPEEGLDEGRKPHIFPFASINAALQSKIISNFTGSDEQFSINDEKKGKINKSTRSLFIVPIKEIYSKYLNHIDPDRKYLGDLNIDSYNFDIPSSIVALNRIVTDIIQKRSLSCSFKNKLSEVQCKVCKEYFRQKVEIDAMQKLLEKNEKRIQESNQLTLNSSTVNNNSKQRSDVLRNTRSKSYIFPSNEINHFAINIWNNAAAKFCISKEKKYSVI